jgi:ubiquinol-cytochrome c reductase cytochrome b subunit
MKSVALFFSVGAVLGLLGGVAQINPVWFYGPFLPQAVSSPAQPDWYLGWLEGALRLFPNWEIRAFGHTVANPFFPAVLLPGITFLLLYLWPFLEQRFTHDRVQHDLLDRPRHRPIRSGLGAAALTFYGVLFFAASNDVIAKLFEVPINAVTWVFRILVVVLPPVVGFGVYRFMRGASLIGAESLLEVPFSAVIRARPSPDGEAPDTSDREEVRA